jgi:hypothetical protein
MVDRQRRRLMLHCLSVDDRHDLGEVLVGVVYVVDFNCLSIDKHVEVLADQLGRPVRCRPIAVARRHHRIAPQRAHDPELIDARLITLRSNDQFNTTIYGYNDRFRGIHGTRMVVLMHRNDIDRLKLHEGDQVSLVTAADDGVDRRLGGLTVVAYDIPEGCCAGYYPECNVLVPLWHHAERAKVPAAKSVPVRVVRDESKHEGFGAPRKMAKAPSDMVSGHPLGDMGRDVTRLGGLVLNAAKAQPVKAAAVALATGLAVGLLAQLRRRGPRR